MSAILPLLAVKVKLCCSLLHEGTAFSVQIAQMIAQPVEEHVRKQNIIAAISERCATQFIADMLHFEGYPIYSLAWNSMIGHHAELCYDHPDADF